MLKLFYGSATAEQTAELHHYIEALQHDEKLASFGTENEQLLYIRSVHPISLSLKDEQIKDILNAQTQVVETIANQVLEKQGKALHPNVKKALQLGLCLTAIFYVPELMLLYTGKELAKKAVAKAVGDIVGTKVVGDKAAKLVEPLSLVVSYFGNIPSLNYLTQVNAVIPEGAQAHLYTQIPCIILAQKLIEHAAQPLLKLSDIVFDSKAHEVATDFFDIMHNPDIDEATLAKYKGSIATMTPEEIVEGVGNFLSWAWKKVAGTNAAQANESIDASQRFEASSARKSY